MVKHIPLNPNELTLKVIEALDSFNDENLLIVDGELLRHSGICAANIFTAIHTNGKRYRIEVCVNEEEYEDDLYTKEETPNKRLVNLSKESFCFSNVNSKNPLF